MGNIIGRTEEKKLLEKITNNSKPEFVALYGRRRVGKTYLIKQFFNEDFSFYLTGMANSNTKLQLGNFMTSYRKYTNSDTIEAPKTWFEAFSLLESLVESFGEKLCVIFLDEMPWLDTPKSNFIMALEHFWNNYGSSKSNLKLIACGSAASWMTNKLINNHGGLHNRVTSKMHIKPFTLAETEEFFKSKNINLERYHIAELYAILGGIPYYLEAIDKGLSNAQNIDRICFTSTGLLINEYNNLFKSLFKDADRHETVIEALALKTQGLTRDKIISLSKLPNGGNASKVIEELEFSGFIRRYQPFSGTSRNSLYHIIDPFVLFFHQFMKKSKADGEGSWISKMQSSSYKAWSGYAFENVCLLHIDQIKKALGINGIYSEFVSWKSYNKSENAQIDLIIDRSDKVINICEMKFASEEFEISKDYAENLKKKMRVFKNETKTKKALFLTLITAQGAQKNSHFISLVQNALTLEDLFT